MCRRVAVKQNQERKINRHMVRTRLNIRPMNPKLPLFRFIEWMILPICFILIVIMVLFVMMTPIVVSSQATEQLENGDIVFVDKFSKFIIPYERGDLLAYLTDSESENVATKFGRLIAYGGEDVFISNGLVYINGSLLDESEYSVPFPADLSLNFTLLDNKLLILPDDRSDFSSVTVDEITFEYDEIIGEVRFRAYPFGKMTLFS